MFKNMLNKEPAFHREETHFKESLHGPICCSDEVWRPAWILQLHAGQGLPWFWWQRERDTKQHLPRDPASTSVSKADAWENIW